MITGNDVLGKTRKEVVVACFNVISKYRGADKFLARPGRKQATTKEDFDLHISNL